MRKLALLAAMLLLVATVPICAMAQESLDIDDVPYLMQMIKAQFIEPVEEAQLVRGAVQGLREHLESAKLSTDHLLSLSPGGRAPEASGAGQPSGQIAGSPDRLKAVYLATLEKHQGKVTEKQVLYAMIKGMLASLKDPYTVFMDPEDYTVLVEHMSGGNFGGVGIYIDLDEKNGGKLTIVEPIEDTPAWSAGLKSGDVILKIDGNDTKGMSIDSAQDLIRGPIGSRVVLTIKRGDAAEKEIPIIRDVIHVKSVTSRVVDGTFGYIKVSFFGDTTNKEMSDAFKKLDESRVQGYILDLRNNGGGYITAAIDVVSKFLPKGSLVVYVVDRYGHRQSYYTDGSVQRALPLVILVNNYSASASEITAGALKELGAGLLVGTRTYGKASVQNIQPLRDGSAMKITVARYFTPRGKNIDKKGIEPDLLVEVKTGEEGDAQMAKAMEYLKAQLARRPGNSKSH